MLLVSPIPSLTSPALWNRGKRQVAALLRSSCKVAVDKTVPLCTFTQDLEGRKKRSWQLYLPPAPGGTFVSKRQVRGLQILWVKTWELLVSMLQVTDIMGFSLPVILAFLDFITSSSTFLLLVGVGGEHVFLVFCFAPFV